VDPRDPGAQKAASRAAQLDRTSHDVLGACSFVASGLNVDPAVIADLLNARYGWETRPGIHTELAREALALEREFNRRAGFTAAHDRIPEWMREEPLPPHNTVFDVPDAELDSVFE
jgi:aldehyde:ferredoxin oxidoreductase